MLEPRQPRPADDITSSAPVARMFTWSRCPRHAWMQVSVLTVLNGQSVCYMPDGSSHVVDRAELELAA